MSHMKVGFRPMQGGNVFETALEQVKHAENIGFDSVWLTEHHGWDVSWPSPQIALGAFASHTTSIQLGTSIVLLPLANPVRLAGEFAMLDDISDGRMILGVALGYQEREFEALNEPIEGRVSRYVDGLKLIRRLFTEETVSFEGKSFELSDFSLSPRPVQSGGPPIWCGGMADKALKRAAYLGDEWLPTWADSLTDVSRAKDTYAEYLASAGGDPREKEYPIIRAVAIAESREKAVERARNHFQPVIEGYLKNGYDMDVDPKEFNDIMDIAEDRIFVGDTEEVLNQMTAFAEDYGTRHMILKIHGPGMDHREVEESLDLLGEHVLPQLHDMEV